MKESEERTSFQDKILVKLQTALQENASFPTSQDDVSMHNPQRKHSTE